MLVSITFRLTKEQKKALDAAAKDQRRTRSAIIIRGIELAIEEAKK